MKAVEGRLREGRVRSWFEIGWEFTQRGLTREEGGD